MSGTRPPHPYHEARRLEQRLGRPAQSGRQLVARRGRGQGLEHLLFSRAKKLR